MSTHSHFMPTHHLVHRAPRVESTRTMSALDVHTGLAKTLTTIGSMGFLLGIWGGLAPFVGPTFGFSADGAGSWHWDLARGILAALPGAAAVVAGLLVLGCARTIALGVGRGGVAIAALVMFASGAWFAIGPLAWPVLWNQNYFIHSSPLVDLARWAGFAAGPGLLFVLFAGVAFGAMSWRDHARLVADDGSWNDVALEDGPEADVTIIGPDD